MWLLLLFIAVEFPVARMQQNCGLPNPMMGMWNPFQGTVQSSCGGGSPCNGGCQQAQAPCRQCHLRDNCYTNKNGYLCCSKELECFMESIMKNPCNQQRWRNANLQRMATDMQKLIQEKFGESFEMVIGSEDFAGRHQFKGDKMCKMKSPDCKTVLAYSSPVQYNTCGCDEEMRPLNATEFYKKPWTMEQNKLSEYAHNVKCCSSC